MKLFRSGKQPFTMSILVMSLSAVTSGLVPLNAMSADDVPEGFHRLPDGSLMVNSGSNTKLPAGYQLTADGLVKKIDEVRVESSEPEMLASSETTEIPPGFHRMPNGDIMANDPSSATAPPGYRLTENGILKKAEAESTTINAKPAQLKQIPPGFHRMPSGEIMANNPSTAVAPDGYHMMANGVLMVNSTSSSSNNEAHEHHHGSGGMWMFDYVYQRMTMDGLLDSTREVSAETAIIRTVDGGEYNYMMAPIDMTMDMHMFMLMYHTRDYMLMGMIHYMSNEMSMLSQGNIKSTMKTSGIADTVLTAQFRGPFKLLFDIGISLPTGSIDERGPMTHNSTFFDPDAKYPYGMQLGSGTKDYIQGITYKDSNSKMGWGAKYEYTGRVEKNKLDYKLGDVLKLEGWLTLNHTSTMNTTFMLLGKSWGQIEGADKDLDASMSPTMDPLNYGGKRLDVGAKFKYENEHMTSFSAELSLPVVQNLYGPQMQTQWIFGLGVGFMF